MLIFVNDTQRAEFERMDSRLKQMVDYASAVASNWGYDLRVTGIERSRERTIEIYRASGKTPPGASVHEVRPCRGLDAVLVPNDAPLFVAKHQAGTELASFISKRFIYPRGKQSCLWHSVSGGDTGLHLHFQVSADGMVIPDALFT